MALCERINVVLTIDTSRAVQALEQAQAELDVWTPRNTQAVVERIIERVDVAIGDR